MRKFLLISVAVVLVGGAGAYFGYPPYVENRVAAEIAQYNKAHPDRSVSITALKADPWTSTLAATRVAVTGPGMSAEMADVTIRMDSFLLLAPAQTVKSFATGALTARDTLAGAVIEAERFEVQDMDVSELQTVTGVLDTVVLAETLDRARFRSLVLEGGRLSRTDGEDATFGRIALTALVGGRLGEFAIEDLTFSGQGESVGVGKIVLRGLELADLDGFDADAERLWTPGASDDPRAQALELGELVLEGVVANPSRGETERVALDRLFLKALRYAPGDSKPGDRAAELEALAIRSVEARGFSVVRRNGDKVTAGAADIAELSGGLLGRVALGQVAVETENGDGGFDSFSIDAINLSEIVRVMKWRETDPNATIPAIAFFRAFGIGGMEAGDLSFRHKDGSLYQVGKVALHDLQYHKGLPISATLTVVDNYQEFPEALIQEQLAALSLPVVLDIPSTSRASGEVLYRMDMESGALTFANRSEDSVYGLRTAFQLRLGGLAPTFEAVADERNEIGKLASEIVLDSLSLEVESDEEWPAPESRDGKPTLRLFMSQFLMQNAAGAPPEANTVVQPVLSFLERGGHFRLALRPPQPIPFLQMQLLPMMPPDQALRAIGLTATHE